MTRLRRWARRDEGRVSILVAVIVPALLFLIAATFDAGGQIRAMQRADNIAMQAARAAGQTIDLPQAVNGGAKEIDPVRAGVAAQAYLDAAGATGTVTISPDRQQVTVTATITYQPRMLGAFGRGPVTVPGRATAQLVI